MADKESSQKPEKQTQSSTSGCVDKPKSVKKTGTRSGKDKLVTEKEGTSMEAKILEALADIKQQQASTDAKFTELVGRVSSLEEYDYYGEEDVQEEGEIDTEDVSPSSSKRPRVDSESTDSRFSLMSKRIKGHDYFGPDVEESLATNINDVFINGLREEEYATMVKDENLPRPKNCESLQTVKCNKVVWDFLSPSAKFLDKKLQNTETSLIKGATLIAQAADSMAKAEIQIKELGIDISSPLDNCQEALSLFGQANKQLNMARREALRPEMKKPYSHLCSSSVPYNEWLFGDIEKSAKEIEDTAKMGHKIQHDYGPTRPMRGRYMTSRGRYMRSRGGSSLFRPRSPLDYGRAQQDPKNFIRRGAPRPPMRK